MGVAYVFTRSGTAWTQQALLVASDPDWGDHFGCSVAIDGDTIVVGADNAGPAGRGSGLRLHAIGYDLDATAATDVLGRLLRDRGCDSR